MRACSCRVLGLIPNLLRSPMLRWNQTSIYVSEKPLHKIVLWLSIWICQCSHWGDLLLRTQHLWIPIPEFLLWKVWFNNFISFRGFLASKWILGRMILLIRFCLIASICFSGFNSVFSFFCLMVWDQSRLSCQVLVF